MAVKGYPWELFVALFCFALVLGLLAYVKLSQKPAHARGHSEQVLEEVWLGNVRCIVYYHEIGQMGGLSCDFPKGESK